MSSYETVPPVNPVVAPQPPVVEKVFIGKDGLRAGWSALIFVAIVIILGMAVAFLIHKARPNAARSAKPPAEITLREGIEQEAIPIVLLLVAAWIMSKIERRRFSVYGLGGERTLAHFFAGTVWGIVFLSLLVLTLWKTGLLVFDGRLLFGGDILRYGAAWLFGFFLVGVNEEFMTRGYLQYTVTRGMAGFYRWAFKTRRSEAFGFWTAALVFSILFGLGHRANPGESPVGLLSAGTIAMVLCFSLWRTGSLWWAIGFHASWDWAQSFLYGVADSGTMAQHHLLATHPVGKPLLSGGATGPEGSIFIFVILGLITLTIFLTLPRTRHAYLQEPSNQLPAGEPVPQTLPSS